MTISSPLLLPPGPFFPSPLLLLLMQPPIVAASLPLLLPFPPLASSQLVLLLLLTLSVPRYVREGKRGEPKERVSGSVCA